MAEIDEDIPSEPSFLIAEQGVSLPSERTAQIEFLRREAEWYSHFQAVLKENVSSQNIVLPNPNLGRSMRDQLGAIVAALEKGDINPLDSYLQEARKLRIVIAQGVIGRHIDRLKQERPIDALWAMYVYSPKWTNSQIDAAIAPVRGAVLGSPSALLGGAHSVD